MRRFFLGALLFSFVSTSAQASEPEPEPVEEAGETVEYPAFRLGIGASLASRPFALFGDEATAGSPASNANLQIPMYLGEHLRLEAEFGMFSQSGAFFPGNALLGSINELGRVRTDVFRFLVGVAWSTKVGKDTLVYVGPKFGMQSRSMEVELADTPTDAVRVKAVDFWVGAATGGEAFLTSHFSLGVEVGYYYLNLGETSLSALRNLGSEEPEHTNLSPWVLTTQGSIAARLYFL